MLMGMLLLFPLPVSPRCLCASLSNGLGAGWETGRGWNAFPRFLLCLSATLNTKSILKRFQEIVHQNHKAHLDSLEEQELVELLSGRDIPAPPLRRWEISNWDLCCRLSAAGAGGRDGSCQVWLGKAARHRRHLSPAPLFYMFHASPAHKKHQNEIGQRAAALPGM